MTPPGCNGAAVHACAADPQGDRTFSYALTDRSLENISNLVRDPAVEDTHQIDRNKFQVESSAPSLRYAGIPAGLEYLSVLGIPGRARDHRSRPDRTVANAGALVQFGSWFPGLVREHRSRPDRTVANAGALVHFGSWFPGLVRGHRSRP